MADFFDEMAATARDLLKPSDQGGLGARSGSVQYIRVTPGPAPANPWDAPTAPIHTELPVRAQSFGIGKELVGTEIENTTLVATDQYVITERIPGGYQAGDIIMLDGQMTTILSVEMIPAVGIHSAVRFIVRGGGLGGVPVAPVVSVQSGSGYAGSVYTSTVPGQWYADNVAILGAFGPIWAMTLAYEGAAIRCGPSNSVKMWTPKLLPSIVALFDIRQGLALSGNNVVAWSSQVGSIVASQTTDANQPVFAASGFGGAPCITVGAGRWLALPGILKNPVARGTVAAVRTNSAGLPIVSRPDSNFTSTFSISTSAQAMALIMYGRGTSGNVRQDFALGGANPSDKDMLVVGTYRSAQDWMIRKNGESDTSGVTPALFSDASTGLRIGNQPGFDGGATPLSSTVLTDGRISVGDAQKSEGWVAHTLNRLDLLPIGHPYKISAPMT